MSSELRATARLPADSPLVTAGLAALGLLGAIDANAVGEPPRYRRGPGVLLSLVTSVATVLTVST